MHLEIFLHVPSPPPSFGSIIWHIMLYISAFVSIYKNGILQNLATSRGVRVPLSADFLVFDIYHVPKF